MKIIIYLLIIIVLLLIIHYSCEMDEKFIKKGKYIKTIYHGKTTIWSIPMYISFIGIIILILAIID